MQNQHTVQLEKYAGRHTRHTCPRCHQPHKFTRYVDTQTGQYIAPEVGRCDRQESCGYHYTPRRWAEDHASLTGTGSGIITRRADTHRTARRPDYSRRSSMPRVAPVVVQQAAVEVPERDDFSVMPYQVWADSTDLFHHSHFAQYILGRFGREGLSRAFRMYMFGISDRWPGATIWWQIDAQERIRTGKVMLYHADTGKRVKNPVARISWMHSLAGMKGYRLRQCLYGEHLLSQPRYSGMPVCIVESEKTAVIASLLQPRRLWLATGGREQLNAARMAPLHHRRVTLCPDTGSYDLWAKKAKAMTATVPRMTVLKEMEDSRWAPGSDIADYLG
ncbi:MAG: hypothetical protein JST76_06905 [Bacteroidetes bacterium]|nr:hypothetical protein [Bacteroidota bacterium]